MFSDSFLCYEMQTVAHHKLQRLQREMTFDLFSGSDHNRAFRACEIHKLISILAVPSERIK